MIQTFSLVVILIFLILCIGFFSSSETAYLSLSKIKLRQLVRQKVRYAKLATKLKNDITGLLTLVLIGTNFMNTLASSLATFFALNLVGQKGVGLASSIITFFVTIFGQIIPKTRAVINPSKTALANAPILFILKKIFFPIIFIFSNIAKIATFISGKILKNQNDKISEEEIKLMIDIGTTEGTLEESERKMLYKIFQFNDLRAHNIMKHRSLINALPVTSTVKDVIGAIQFSGYSKIPLYEKNLDTIVGVISYETVLHRDEQFLNENNFVKNNMTKPLYIPETFSALEVLSAFKKSKEDFAVVLDEQGCTAGIITRDDIIRVVFGRIIDEHASENSSPESRIKIISKNEYIIPGDISLEDVNNIVSLSLESEDFNTFGGYVLEKFGYLPSIGEIVTDKLGAYIVEDVERRRIVSVRLKLRS